MGVTNGEKQSGHGIQMETSKAIMVSEVLKCASVWEFSYVLALHVGTLPNLIQSPRQWRNKSEKAAIFATRKFTKLNAKLEHTNIQWKSMENCILAGIMKVYMTILDLLAVP
jgi:hypothetical protein